jgi:hypothetical protein
MATLFRRSGSASGEKMAWPWASPGLCARQAGPLCGLRKNGEKGSGKERLVGPGLASSWVSAHCQIGIRKSFYNLQTNLNSIQI